jgi:uncharacterized membrane protein (UPF0127 family)
MPTFVIIQNTSSPLEQPPGVRICDTFSSRLRGFMFQRHLGRDDGLLLVMERDSRIDSAIHMLFVPFDLAVFWIDSNLEIVDKVIARSWRPAYIPSRGARYVLEVHPDLFPLYDVGAKVSMADA